MSRDGQHVLVLGSDPRSFLSIIRSLGRAGLRVHIAWHPSDSVVLHSRYLHRAHELPAYRENDTAWLVALRRLLEAEHFELVIPTNDPSVTAFQRHKAALSGLARLYTINDQAFEILFDKIKTNELARNVGVPTPDELVVAAADQASGVVRDFGPPVVLKPRTSYNSANPASNLVVRSAHSQEELEWKLIDMLQDGSVAIQKNCLGHGVGIELLMEDGRPLLAFQHERVHEPPLGGGSSYRRSVPLTPELFDASVRLLAAINYTGIAMVEFKVNPQTGDWRLMEVNARFWGSLPLALAAGADFPLALYELLVEGRVEVPNRYRTGLYCRNWFLDASWQRANRHDGPGEAAFAQRSVSRFLWELFVNTVRLRERSDTLTLDDPRPAIAELAGMFRHARAETRFACRTRWLGSRFMRHRLARRAERDLADSRHVLFVCMGNVCRSSFAEHLYRKLRPDVQAVSAGYYPQAGRPSPANAIAASREWELDLATHSSCVVNEEMVRQADAVFLFDLENYETLTERFPFARKRMHFVGALRNDGPLFIEDPWDTTLDGFRECYRQIEASLRATI